MDRPRLAKDIMVTKLVTVTPEMHVFDGIKRLLANNVSGAPVIDGEGHYLGVLSEKCCLGVLALSAQLGNETGAAVEERLRARDIMTRKLVVFSPDDDVFDAISLLLKHRISGAPVVSSEGRFLGVFSEKYSMSALVRAAYERVPTTRVGNLMNTDAGRTIEEDTGLLAITQLFLSTPYRRLPVLRDGRLVGQISRRDVLRAEHHLSSHWLPDEALLERSGEITRSDNRDTPRHGRLPTTDVASFMDENARTIDRGIDLLSVAQIFLSTNFRRLPVLEDGALVGQISRRDVLSAAEKLTRTTSHPEQALLYLSAVFEPGERPIA